jgi:hypothetical protein
MAHQDLLTGGKSIWHWIGWLCAILGKLSLVTGRIEWGDHDIEGTWAESMTIRYVTCSQMTLNLSTQHGPNFCQTNGFNGCSLKAARSHCCSRTDSAVPSLGQYICCYQSATTGAGVPPQQPSQQTTTWQLWFQQGFQRIQAITSQILLIPAWPTKPPLILHHPVIWAGPYRLMNRTWEAKRLQAQGPTTQDMDRLGWNKTAETQPKTSHIMRNAMMHGWREKREQR